MWRTQIKQIDFVCALSFHENQQVKPAALSKLQVISYDHDRL